MSNETRELFERRQKRIAELNEKKAKQSRCSHAYSITVWGVGHRHIGDHPVCVPMDCERCGRRGWRSQRDDKIKASEANV